MIFHNMKRGADVPPHWRRPRRRCIRCKLPSSSSSMTTGAAADLSEADYDRPIRELLVAARRHAHHFVQGLLARERFSLARRYKLTCPSRIQFSPAASRTHLQ